MIRINRFRVLFATLAIAVAAPLFAGFASTETFLPAVGRVPGLNGAQFYTTVWATNLTSARQTFTFHFLKTGQANASPLSFDDALEPGQTKVYENIVETKLGLANALGAARITSSGEIFVAERIYNQAPGADLGNTEGLFFAGVPKSFSISAGQSASIQGIDQGGFENFRYNFAMIETGGGSPTVNVQVFDGAGTMLGQKSYPLKPYEHLQPGVADVVAGIQTTNARITATVTSGTGSVLLAGAQLANESQDSSGFEMTFRDSLLGSGSSGGNCTLCVTSLNGLTGALTLTPGSGISITPSGQSIAIAYTGGGGAGGITSVTHDGSLSGAGTGASPLAIANGQVVRSLNGVHDAVTLAAGTNVTITPSGSTLTIASGGGGLTLPFSGSTGDAHPAFQVTSTGSSAISGTSTSTASGVVGTSGSGDGVYGQSDGGDGVHGKSSAALPSAGVSGENSSGTGVLGQTSGGIGVYGVAADSGTGVQGYSNGGDGVYGIDTVSTSHAGVHGVFNNPSGLTGHAGVWGDSNNGAGVLGTTSTTNSGVLGVATSGTGVYGQSTSGYAIYANGTLGASGVKTFVEPHPTDPSKEIRYVCLEGPEAGTYFRGTSRIVNGFATIPVPDHFRMVTSAAGITVQATPSGDFAALTCIKKSLDLIVIKGSADVEFDYVVNGIRKSFAAFQPIGENKDFAPKYAGDDLGIGSLPAESVRRLKANGTLNPDGTINLETAHRLGWDKQESWKRAEAGNKGD